MVLLRLLLHRMIVVSGLLIQRLLITTFTADDFVSIIEPQRRSVSNTNGASYLVIGVGVVNIPPSFSLSNTLIVPSLSTKLISVGQVAKELNCVVLMYLHFCLVKISSRRRSFGMVNVNQVQGSSTSRETHIQL